VQHHPKASLRFALAAGITVALVAAVSAVGGVGYATHQVSHAVVAVKHAAVGKASPTVAKSAGKQYKNAPVIRNVRGEPDPVCSGGILIITGQNLDSVTEVTVGGTPVKIIAQNKNHITVKLSGGETGPVTVSGPNGSDTYKKAPVGKCH
jgi:IPT/TIG domain